MRNPAGWIPWEGADKAPVSPSTIVEVRYRIGIVSSLHEPVGELRWTHKGWDGDIIAYREANALDMPVPGE